MSQDMQAAPKGQISPRQQSRQDKVAFREREAVRRADETRDAAVSRATKAEAEVEGIRQENAKLFESWTEAKERVKQLESGKELKDTLELLEAARNARKAMADQLQAAQDENAKMALELDLRDKTIDALKAEIATLKAPPPGV